MKILITNHSLENLGGTERSVIELARALQARGHDVVACSSQIGEAGRLIKEKSISVISSPLDSPFQPDVIHGQHHLDTMRAIAAFPNTPVIYHHHGFFPWVEDPPFHPRITHYLCMCEVLTEKLRINGTKYAPQYLILNNWFDDYSFVYPKKPQKIPKKALLYNRTFNKDSNIAKKFVEIFKNNGIELDLNPLNNYTETPELLLKDYDIVLAAGKSAVEAMATGCAVMPVSDQSCLDFISLKNFDEYKKQNFSPLAYSPSFNIQVINDWIQNYDASQVELVCQKIRSENSISHTATRLEKIYAESIDHFNKDIKQHLISLESELEAFSKYIQTIMPLVREHGKLTLENRALEIKNAHMKLEIQRVHQSFSMRITQPLRWLNQQRIQLKRLLLKK